MNEVKVDYSIFPFWTLGFGCVVHYSDANIRFLFHYPELLTSHESRFGNQYVSDLLGLFQEFEDFKQSPTLAEAYHMILSHVLVPKEQISLFDLQKCDDYGKVQEEIYLFNGNIKQLISGHGKIKIMNFGRAWEYHDSGLFLESNQQNKSIDFDLYSNIEQRVRKSELNCVLKLSLNRGKCNN